jgi:hypothetical protein
LCDPRHCPTQLHHGTEGKERQHPISSTTLPYFQICFSISLYF